MASYSSDHKVKNWLTVEALTEELAACLHRNMNLDCNEAGYRFWIFKNGVMVFNETYQTWDGAERYGYNSDTYYEHLEELDQQEAVDAAEINGIMERAKALAQVKQDAGGKGAA